MIDSTTTKVSDKTERPVSLAGAFKNRASRIKKARGIAGEIFALYEQNDKIGQWELDKATDAIYSYISELEK